MNGSVRRKLPVALTRALTCAALCAALMLGLPSPTAFIAGIGSADAGEYYTRKRVNGKWITGRFRRKADVRTDSMRPGDEAKDSIQITSALPALPLDENDPLLPLRRGLEARARALALEVQAQQPRTVKLVTVDFENRVKIIVFSDGTREQEFLDQSARATGIPDAVPCAALQLVGPP